MTTTNVNINDGEYIRCNECDDDCTENETCECYCHISCVSCGLVLCYRCESVDCACCNTECPQFACDCDE